MTDRYQYELQFLKLRAQLQMKTSNTLCLVYWSVFQGVIILKKLKLKIKLGLIKGLRLLTLKWIKRKKVSKEFLKSLLITFAKIYLLLMVLD